MARRGRALRDPALLRQAVEAQRELFSTDVQKTTTAARFQKIQQNLQRYEDALVKIDKGNEQIATEAAVTEREVRAARLAARAKRIKDPAYMRAAIREQEKLFTVDVQALVTPERFEKIGAALTKYNDELLKLDTELKNKAAANTAKTAKSRQQRHEKLQVLQDSLNSVEEKATRRIEAFGRKSVISSEQTVKNREAYQEALNKIDRKRDALIKAGMTPTRAPQLARDASDRVTAVMQSVDASIASNLAGLSAVYQSASVRERRRMRGQKLYQQSGRCSCADAGGISAGQPGDGPADGRLRALTASGDKGDNMNRFGFILLGALFACAASAQMSKLEDLMKEAGKLPKAPGGGQNIGAGDEKTNAAGIKEALAIGTEKAVQSLSRENGYFGNAAVKIQMPSSIQKVADVARMAGYQKQVDAFVLSMNRAAEAAAPMASRYFVTRSAA